MFQCFIQICGFPALDRVLQGELIDKLQWIHWDAESPREEPMGGAYEVESSASETNSTEANIDSDSDIDLESLMDTDNERVSDVDNFDWENYPLPESVEDLRSQLLTARGMSTNSPANSPQDVPDNYRPATPIYSPASPDYSPSMSPVHVDTDSSDSITPSNNSDGAISTRDCDMFDLANTDSDQEIEGEAETIALVGDYINRGKLPVKMKGVFIFPQPAHVHNLTWDEFPFEPCSIHCIMPERSDKSLARFYLTHSLCLNHKSSLCNMGPWIYFCKRVSTLPKLHKSPQILNFISLLHKK